MDAAFPRVLVVDDEDSIRLLLEYGLGIAGFEVQCAADGRIALDVMHAWTPEAILLDVSLPGVDGLAMLPVIRRATDVPIVMLTARTATTDKVAAFTRGADDYISKPFDMEELVARLHAALRRPRMLHDETVTYATLKIDVARRTVVRGTRRIDLSSREFDLLLALARGSERVFSRDELLDIVWGPDRDVGPSAVETCISYLRSKVDVAGEPRLIQTLRGAGYTLRRDKP